MSPAAQKPRSLNKLVILALCLALLGVLAWYVGQNFTLDEIADREDQLRQFIALNPWRAFLLGFVIYLALALVPGTGGKAILWGWLFGFWLALVTVSIGLTIAAMIIFILSRYLFQESIERRYPHFLTLMNRHLEKEGAFYLLTLRLIHAPFSIVNPVSGASRIRAWTFFWTTALGLLPANAIWAYVGVQLPSLRELATHGPESLIDRSLGAALLACALLPLLIRWLIRRFGMPAVKTTDPDNNSNETREVSP